MESKQQNEIDIIIGDDGDEDEFDEDEQPLPRNTSEGIKGFLRVDRFQISYGIFKCQHFSWDPSLAAGWYKYIDS